MSHIALSHHNCLLEASSKIRRSSDPCRHSIGDGGPSVKSEQRETQLSLCCSGRQPGSKAVTEGSGACEEVMAGYVRANSIARPYSKSYKALVHVCEDGEQKSRRA